MMFLFVCLDILYLCCVRVLFSVLCLSVACLSFVAGEVVILRFYLSHFFAKECCEFQFVLF